MERSVIAFLHGPDQPDCGKVAGWIHEHGGNVLHADQHLDRQENIFFQRVEWSPQQSRDFAPSPMLFPPLRVRSLA